MTFRLLEIPGQTTTFDSCPEVVFQGGGHSSMRMTVRYHASENLVDSGMLIGEISFSDVLEFRWVEHDVSYEGHAQHEDDYELGLIEILDSAYVEMMAARGVWRDRPGTRIRDQPESLVRHFRMGFDDWGTLDVIATQIAIESSRRPYSPR